MTEQEIKRNRLDVQNALGVEDNVSDMRYAPLWASLNSILKCVEFKHNVMETSLDAACYDCRYGVVK